MLAISTENASYSTVRERQVGYVDTIAVPESGGAVVAGGGQPGTVRTDGDSINCFGVVGEGGAWGAVAVPESGGAVGTGGGDPGIIRADGYCAYRIAMTAKNADHDRIRLVRQRYPWSQIWSTRSTVFGDQGLDFWIA